MFHVQHEIKLCLLGDSGVGKTSIVLRYVHNAFNAKMENTMGASYLTKILHQDDLTYKFNIWDTAGQELYRCLAPLYYRNCVASIIVYDVTQYRSFQSVKTWVRELQLHGPPNVILAIAGNKSDLEKSRKVSFNEGKRYADSVNAVFIETSALAAVNIHELFEEIARRLPKKQIEIIKHEISLTNTPDKKRRCCSRRR